MNTLMYPEVEQSIVIDSSQYNAPILLGTSLCTLLRSFEQPFDKIILLFIGSDRATGDSLGPLIGYKLQNSQIKYDSVEIYGTLESPVHATNLTHTINMIYKVHTEPLIIAVDACLGDISTVGYLSVRKGYVSPGAGVGKNLPLVGDIAIAGIVNCSSSLDLLVLQNTSLNIIMKMADVIASGIYYALQMFLEE